MADQTNAEVSDERLREIIAGCEGVQGGPWQLDAFACYVWAPSEKGGDFPLMDELGEKGRVAELRGWGYYTGNGHGALGLDPDEARRRQKLTGEHVARLDPATVKALATELLTRRSVTSQASEGADDLMKIGHAVLDLALPPSKGQSSEYRLAYNSGVVAAADLIKARSAASPSKRVERLETALNEIVAWEFPETGKFWENTDGTMSDRPMSYGAAFGSNGERDYMREIARQALQGRPLMTTLDTKALEAAAKALRPDLFSDVEQVRHHAASPMSVNVMQERYRQQAETSVAAYLDALSSLPAQAVGVKAAAAVAITDEQIDEIIEESVIGGTDDYPAINRAGLIADLVLALDALHHGNALAPSQPAAVGERHGIYIASKTKHAARWRALRDQGVPVISTWIDEAGEGESQDLRDLWRRCLAEPAGAAALIVYREPDEVLKGGWIELGAAASHDVPVFAVGIREFTISNHEGIRHFDTFDAALEAALRSTP